MSGTQLRTTSHTKKYKNTTENEEEKSIKSNPELTTDIRISSKKMKGYDNYIPYIKKVEERQTY